MTRVTAHSDDSQDYTDVPIVEHDIGMKKHPLGVRPSGNALTSDVDLRDHMGVFGRIPDELVMLLLEWLDEDALKNLSNTCRGFFAYCTSDQLWRDLSIRSPRPDFKWQGSWRASLLRLPSAKLPCIDCRHLFSDALHRPFLCSQISLSSYTSHIPHGNEIPRLSDLRLDEFAEGWANRPFILTQPVKAWPIFRQWSQETLLKHHGNIVFRAEAVEWPLSTYVDYMTRNDDESPLYLFDRNFVSKMNLEVGPAGGYWLPQCFGEDFFELLGEQRPDHRWLVVGPTRSGSTFHKDPNATSAWNAVIRGSKYWIIFPSSVTPPGVFLSEDESEVTSPLSIAEWLLTFHGEARRTAGCLEGICGPGEVLHVPAQSFHLVINLEPSIAITQNFVPRSHLRAAVDFLKHKPDQVSGFTIQGTEPHSLFVDRLAARHPELMEALKGTNSKKRTWGDMMRGNKQQETGGFSFGFGGDIEEEGVQ